MTDTKWSKWIEWNAVDDSSCPIPDGTLHQVIFSDGGKSFVDGNPATWAWGFAEELSITAYRYELTEDPDARMDNIARNGNDGEHYPPAEQSMPADLEHLARTVLEWSESLDRVCRHKIGVEWFSSERFPGRHGYSQSEWLQARRDLGLVTTEGEDEAFDAMAAADMINHPPHYQSDNGIECIDAIRAALGKEGFIAYCRGNIIKYQWRLKANPAEDQGKSVWYANRAREAMEE